MFGGVGGIFNDNNTFTRCHFGLQEKQRFLNEVLGDAGGGLEYRFTPHIGLFTDARYNFVNGPQNNFMLTRFGVRYAF